MPPPSIERIVTIAGYSLKLPVMFPVPPNAAGLHRRVCCVPWLTGQMAVLPGSPQNSTKTSLFAAHHFALKAYLMRSPAVQSLTGKDAICAVV